MIKMFKNMSKKEAMLAIISILFIVMQVWLELKIPDYMQKITTLVATGGVVSDIIDEGIWMILCALGSLITAIIIGYLSSYVGTSFEKHLRAKVFRKVQNFGMEEIKNFSTSSLITRDTNDVTQVKTFVVMGTQMLARAPIMAFMAIMKIIGKEWQFSLVTGIGVAIVVTMVTLLVTIVVPRFKKIQTLTDNVNRITRENLTGIKVVRAFNAAGYQQEKFDKANRELTNTNLFVGRAMSIMSPVMTGVMSGLSLSIYWIGATLINEAGMLDKVTIFSDMIVFSSYAVQVIMSFMFLVIIFVIYPRAAVSMNRLAEILEKDEKIKDGKNNLETGLKGVIELKNVSFKYPDADECILENINLSIHQGETVAFIGGTGSGKSTLINLIPRFYDVTEGEIIIDGVNVKDMSLTDLHNKIGYVSQKAVMFKGSVKSNIKFGRNHQNISDIQMNKALEVACADDFVEKLENGIDGTISQGGTNLSGGQKQRLSIARAILKNPEIYIFDDSFSALDYKTDYTLRKELNKVCKDATKLIVAQRIGTIIDADKIVVLDSGKCVGIGKHEELLKKCRIYREICESQLGKEELYHES